MNYNRIILGGHLTRDWQLRSTQGGLQVANSGLGVNRRSKGGDDVMFVDLVVFDKLAELLTKHTGKGNPLLVEGRLSLSQWEGKDGARRSKHEVIVETFQFVKTDEGYRKAVQYEQESKREPTPSDDDIPF